MGTFLLVEGEDNEICIHHWCPEWRMEIEAGNDYGFVVSGRTRYEQRFVEGGDEMGNRFRQFLRLDIPFKEKGKWKAVLWNETFLNADDTDWGQRAGIDQVRNFAGLGIPVTSNFNIEAGYLNQLVNRPGDNLVNHAFSTYFNVRF